MNNQIKHYHSYHEMIMDFTHLSSAIDAEKTLSKAPIFSFYTKDGMIHLGGTFQIFLVKLVAATGIKLLPLVSIEMPGVYAISYEDYTPVDTPVVDESKIEVKAVDTPARKRAARSKSTTA